jgi:hypothetical protein
MAGHHNQRSGIPHFLGYFLLLVFTVHYARKQWQSMNDTLSEVRRQSGFVETSSKAAIISITNAEEAF